MRFLKLIIEGYKSFQLPTEIDFTKGRDEPGRNVDLIGGIDVVVPKTIHDEEYPTIDYGIETFHIDAGPQHLDGETALKYARTRHGDSDIHRARRQQQVIFAIRDKITAYNMIPELAVQAPALWSELREGIDTGLGLDQILQLAWWVKDIPSTNYRNGVLGWEYVIPTNWQGQDLLVPNRSKVEPLMVEVFGPAYNQ